MICFLIRRGGDHQKISQMVKWCDETHNIRMLGSYVCCQDDDLKTAILIKMHWGDCLGEREDFPGSIFDPRFN